MKAKKNKEIRHCKHCGDIIPDYISGFTCQPCGNYFSKHPEGIYDIPKYGEVAYALNGDPICHICGQAHRKLGNHIRLRHHMSQSEYRDTFGLYRNTRLSNKDYVKHMSSLNDKYKDIVVEKNLIEKGTPTRMTTEFSRSFRHRRHNKPIKEVYAFADNK